MYYYSDIAVILAKNIKTANEKDFLLGKALEEAANKCIEIRS